MNTIKAQVAIVKIGHLEIEGLMMPDGTYAVAIPQVADLFQTSRNTASRDFKRLVGEGFETSKVRTEFNQKDVNVISLTEFEKLLIKLDRAGNVHAQEFRDSLVGMAITQLFNDAFKIKFDEVDRQNWLKERQTGKFYRRSLTDAVKYLIEQGYNLNYGEITLKTYEACHLLSKYNEYKNNHKDHGFRNTLPDSDLRKISKFEEYVADLIIVDKFPIESALIKAATYIR